MPERLSAEELAARAGQPLPFVERLVVLGVMAPGADGLFAGGEVMLVHTMAAFEESGIALEDVAAGVASGELDYGPVETYFPEPPRSAGTVAELAASLGRTPESVARLLEAFGLPRPAPGDRVREDDAATLAAFLHAWELLDEEELIRLARFQGDALRRVATTNVRFFDELVRMRVERMDVSEGDGGRIVAEMARRAITSAGDVVGWLHARHFERAVVRYMAETTEHYLDERGIRPRPPRRPPAIAFLDLTGFTSLTEDRGDAVAADLASRLAVVVDEASRAHGGQAVKWLGDGVMFHFADPAGAVLCALDLVRRAPEAVEVPARVGVNAGPVVFQDGDYFGRTVNVAARIADYARPGEVLVSRAVLEAGAPGELDYERIGEIPLRGVGAPVELLRARSR
ncbi:MAG TPA: adenylate/guanylate cyclase domain-containing protein [Gaiellaceae bacterium]|nr:adenylate/guanylate cyclase domain-containing protein [Gaiellaceae bacterium]